MANPFALACTSQQPSALRRIGQGFCGTVWSAPIFSIGEHQYAIKREDGGPGRSLRNDYDMHIRVLVALFTSQYSPKVYIPRCHRYVLGTDSEWWNAARLSSFPVEFQVPCNALVTDRIPPFTSTVREKIIDSYCPASLKDQICSSDSNSDCLIRPYLGRRRRQRMERHSTFQGFSLRNYPLHIDQIEDLRLDATLYARIMAETLADLFWRAHVDANDIEFVLAPPPTWRISPTMSTQSREDGINGSSGSNNGATISHTVNDIMYSTSLGEYVLYILDFDCCQPMPMTEDGVEQAAAAFYRNDPFYPRPGREDSSDQDLWREFKDRFLRSSKAILAEASFEQRRLPGMWIDLVEHKGWVDNKRSKIGWQVNAKSI